jgi:signal transduction histidine kinase
MRFGDVGMLNKNQMELLEQLHQTNMRLYHFVQGLNDATKLESGELPVKPVFIAITDAIDEAAGTVSVEVRKKNLSLHWRHPTAPVSKAYADKDHIRQILLNILSNAVKFTQEAGHIEISVKEITDAVEGGKAAKFIQISIEDNGRGISKAMQPRIFERFFRDETVRRLGIPGAGLGLYIGKKLAELNGGKMWFTSEVGKGTTFAFELPMKEARKS